MDRASLESWALLCGLACPRNPRAITSNRGTGANISRDPDSAKGGPIAAFRFFGFRLLGRREGIAGRPGGALAWFDGLTGADL